MNNVNVHQNGNAKNGFEDMEKKIEELFKIVQFQQSQLNFLNSRFSTSEKQNTNNLGHRTQPPPTKNGRSKSELNFSGE